MKVQKNSILQYYPLLVYPFFMFKVIRKKDQDMFETHVDSLVRADHPYRKLLNAIDLKKIS